jgi:hypothetical protein
MERVVVETAPGTAFEVVEAEFFLEVLVSLVEARVGRG